MAFSKTHVVNSSLAKLISLQKLHSHRVESKHYLVIELKVRIVVGLHSHPYFLPTKISIILITKSWKKNQARLKTMATSANLEISQTTSRPLFILYRDVLKKFELQGK